MAIGGIGGAHGMRNVGVLAAVLAALVLGLAIAPPPARPARSLNEPPARAWVGGKGRSPSAPRSRPPEQAALLRRSGASCPGPLICFRSPYPGPPRPRSKDSWTRLSRSPCTTLIQ